MIDTWIKPAAQVASLACFGMVATRAAYDWRWRRGGGVALWLATTFGVLAAMILLTLVANVIWGESWPPFIPATLSMLLVAFPLTLAMFSASFDRSRLRVVRVVAAVAVVLAVWTLLIPSLPSEGHPRTMIINLYALALSAMWTAVTGWVIVGIWRRGARRPDLVRARDRTLVISLVTLALGFIAFALGVELAASILSGMSGIAAFLAYAPPAQLRGAWRRHDLERLRLSMGGLMETQTRADVGRIVLPHMARMLGARAGALFERDGSLVTSHDMDEATLDEVRRLQDDTDIRGSGDEFTSSGSLLWACRADLWIVLQVEGGFPPAVGREEADLVEANLWVLRVAIDRIRQIEQLRQREDNLLAAQLIAGFGSYTWVAATGQLEWSDSLYEIVGIDSTEPIDIERYISILHPDDRDKVSAAVRGALEAGQEYEIRHRLVRPDGDIRHMVARGRPLRNENGTTIGLTGIEQDVTEQMRIEEHLRAAFDSEREATTRLQAIDAMKNTILSAVSHELRTPLTSVIGMALTLRDRRSTLSEPQQEELLDHLATESERLEQLLSDLLDLDRLRRGVIEPRRECVDVAALLRDTLAPLDLEVECDLESITFALDPAKVQRIVENLVINAARHTPPGTQVWVRSRRCPDEGIEIRVEDDGPGVPEDQRYVIFEPFNRGNQDLGYSPGTGIGLALVQQFTDLHGGTVWVEDRTGGGSSFVVRLPGAIDDLHDGDR